MAGIAESGSTEYKLGITDEKINAMINKLSLTPQKFAQYFDHTLLKENATKKEIKKLCDEALKYRVKAVCIRPDKVEFVRDYFSKIKSVESKNAKIKKYVPKICTVIGFPEGNNTMHEKLEEAKKAVYDGAEELDMVLNRELFKRNYCGLAKEEIKMIVEVAKEKDKNNIVKVILENCELTPDEIVGACELVMSAGADYVKTSTGFKSSGATLEDVILMKKTVGDSLKIKAAGGIKDTKTALRMTYCGASRIGASKTVDILKEFA